MKKGHFRLTCVAQKRCCLSSLMETRRVRQEPDRRAWAGPFINHEANGSLRKQPEFPDATTAFPAKWRLRTKCRNSILMTRHYPDLDSASDWLKIYFIQSEVLLREGNASPDIVVISARVPQTSFRAKTNFGVVKCRLFSQARLRYLTLINF